jgi:hypothetical protein
MLRWPYMSKEVPLQASLFDGDLVDTRTRSQKKRAEEQASPRQAEMFSQRELAQFGVQARPQLPISPKTRIELLAEDRRTEEEKERELQRQIAELTYPMPGISEYSGPAAEDE